jgi:hypothetical protein
VAPGGGHVAYQVVGDHAIDIILLAHIADGADLVAARLADAGELPLVKRLGVFVDAVLANHTGDPRLHQVLFEEAPRPPELLEELHALEESMTRST